MKRKLLITITILALSAAQVKSAQKDAAMQPVTEASLIRGIKAAPLRSPEAGLLIRRAYQSGLSKTAYDQYTRIWQKQPQNAYANLQLGEAAESYWEYSTKPDVKLLSITSPQAEEVFHVAYSSLATALKLAPHDASTNLAYGAFLFWHGSQMREGLEFIKKAVAIQPKRYNAHAVLGRAYAEYSGEVYDTVKAEKELKLASALKPSESFPHWQLIRVYLDGGRLQDAKRELQAYVNLTPPSETQTQVVNFYQNQFNHVTR